MARKKIITLKDQECAKNYEAHKLSIKNLDCDPDQFNPYRMFDQVADNVVDIIQLLDQDFLQFLKEEGLSFHPLAKKKVHWSALWNV